MTDLNLLREELKLSTEPLTSDFWEKQNREIAKMQIDFEEKRRELSISTEKLKQPFWSVYS